MPSKYVIRNFYDGGYYHVVNRGLNKQLIFMDEVDKMIYLRYLEAYISPPELVPLIWPTVPKNVLQSNIHGQVSLLAYCLMPNHVHLLLRSDKADGVSNLVRRLHSAYSQHCYLRHGSGARLMHGKYRSVEVPDESVLLREIRYVHLNPVRAGLVASAADYPWSSMGEYLSKRIRGMCDQAFVWTHFSGLRKDFKSFVAMVDASDFEQRATIFQLTECN